MAEQELGSGELESKGEVDKRIIMPGGFNIHIGKITSARKITINLGKLYIACTTSTNRSLMSIFNDLYITTVSCKRVL